jgi:hypothetical protein
VENSLAAEQPSKPQWSNSREPLNAGWPSYEFGDGSNGFSGILRRANGEPSVRLFSRSTAETPNRFSVEFQDALNEHQQDSFSAVDTEDVSRSGQEVTAILTAIGIANFNQAGRILKLSLDKSTAGNTYIEFETSVKALGVRAGDLITVTYLKEGFDRQPFRVLRIAPGVNHRIATITAQIHDDSWYADANGQTNASGGRRQGNAGLGAPRPLPGDTLDETGAVQFSVAELATTASDGTAATSLHVGFVAPTVAAGAGPGIPLLSLVAQEVAGGQFEAGRVLYYSVAGVDTEGNEGGLSFIARASIFHSGSSVALTGLSFAPGTALFHVYRGETPAQLYRIASSCPLTDQFTDTGLADQLIAPPDPNFDHANFYWRMELQPEIQVTAHSGTTVANGTVAMKQNAYRGATVRITRGRGATQERAILSNDATTVTVAPPWDTEPDTGSFFAISESSWKFGALSRTSPAEFEVPNRSGETAQLMGRAANANDVECAAELSIVTRWQIGGSAGDAGDLDVPPTPSFGVGAGRKGGTIELNGVSFTDLTNTASISAATLILHYRDELTDATAALAADIGGSETQIAVAALGPAAAGALLQIDAEVVRLEESLNGGTQYQITRAIHGTMATSHAAGSLISALETKTVIAPFPRGFFGSPYSGNWSFPLALPDARVATAELFVTNRVGNSATGIIHLTNSDDLGLRTLSGGQYSIQVSGFLAIDGSAAPPLIIDESHAVRDVYAVLGTAADATVTTELRVNGATYCTLTFLAGANVSMAKAGKELPPLRSGDQVTLAVTSVGQTQPGADLTVLIRL